MKRKIRLVLLALMGAALLGSVYNYRSYRADKNEYEAIKTAYSLRHSYEAGSKAYLSTSNISESRRHEALYNLAQVNLREALEKGDIQRLNAAIEYYSEALRVVPDFTEAKKMLELAKNLLEKAEEAAKKGGGDGKGDKEGGKEKGDQKHKGTLPGLEPYEPSKP